MIFLTVLGISFFFFSKNNNISDSSAVKEKIFNTVGGVADNKIKFTNPLTGELIDSEVEPEFFKNRPLGVMVNNALPARPQAGLTKADIVYEIVAEGGITRFLAIYFSELPEKVGPIRSVREYYLVILKEIGNGMLMHIGYSPQALQKLSEWDISSLGLTGADFYRDNRGNPNVATEHTAFANANELMVFAKATKLNYPVEITPWKFGDLKNKETLKKANKIKIDFWYEGDYTGYFEYNPSENNYTRYSGVVENKPQLLIDDLTKTPVKVKNLVVQFANEVPIPNDDKNRLDYELLGSGNAIVFRDGYIINATWRKDSLKNRTIFYDLNGQEIEFNRGKFWVSVVPSRNENQVKFTE